MMRATSQISALWIIAVVFVAAETPGAQQSPPASGEQQRDITAVGCVVELDRSGWRPSTSGNTPPGGSVNSRPRYGLKDATVSEPGKESQTNPEREFALRGDDATIGKHAGHQVEVKGHLVRNDQTDSDKTGSQRLHTLSEGGNDLQVTSIRSTKDRCTRYQEHR
jgi:hypothetical protein